MAKSSAASEAGGQRRRTGRRARGGAQHDALGGQVPTGPAEAGLRTLVFEQCPAFQEQVRSGCEQIMDRSGGKPI